MDEILQLTVDKFTFSVPADRYYSPEGVWAESEGDQIRVGLADFPQQRSGDIAFAEIGQVGTPLDFGEQIATIETIKVTLSLGSPAAGTVVAVNSQLEAAPELINQDPYGAGWLAVVEPAHWEADCDRLLDARAYFEQMKKQVEEEAGA